MRGKEKDGPPSEATQTQDRSAGPNITTVDSVFIVIIHCTLADCA
jgi:hypothetical protein